ncbi:MAG: hypothetical protein GY820_32345 [Gammaproteobacteria bacterium]|nr:hypothetical protein [Gammaproteobacteria bacterium]
MHRQGFEKSVLLSVPSKTAQECFEGDSTAHIHSLRGGSRSLRDPAHWSNIKFHPYKVCKSCRNSAVEMRQKTSLAYRERLENVIENDDGHVEV